MGKEIETDKNVYANLKTVKEQMNVDKQQDIETVEEVYENLKTVKEQMNVDKQQDTETVEEVYGNLKTVKEQMNVDKQQDIETVEEVYGNLPPISGKRSDPSIYIPESDIQTMKKQVDDKNIYSTVNKPKGKGETNLNKQDDEAIYSTVNKLKGKGETSTSKQPNDKNTESDKYETSQSPPPLPPRNYENKPKEKEETNLNKQDDEAIYSTVNKPKGKGETSTSKQPNDKNTESDKYETSQSPPPLPPRNYLSTFGKFKNAVYDAVSTISKALSKFKNAITDTNNKSKDKNVDSHNKQSTKETTSAIKSSEEQSKYVTKFQNEELKKQFNQEIDIYQLNKGANQNKEITDKTKQDINNNKTEYASIAFTTTAGKKTDGNTEIDNNNTKNNDKLIYADIEFANPKTKDAVLNQAKNIGENLNMHSLKEQSNFEKNPPVGEDQSAKKSSSMQK